MVAQIVRELEAEQFKSDIPEFGPGDTVRVHAKVVEGNRERIQVFEGLVMRMRNGGARVVSTRTSRCGALPHTGSGSSGPSSSIRRASTRSK